MEEPKAVKNFFTSNAKLVIGILAILAVAGAAWYIIWNLPPTLSFYTVSRGNITASVDAPGSVSSSNSVDLSFQESGQIAAVYVKDGDAVTQGEALASLDNSLQQTQLSQEQASLAAATANYDKILAGATTQDIQTSEDAVTLAQQNVNNAYTGALNTLNNTYTAMNNAATVTHYIQTTYFNASDQQGIAVQSNNNIINTNITDAQNYIAIAQKSTAQTDIDSAILHVLDDANNVYNSLTVIRQQCDQGVYNLQVSASDKTSLDTQKTDINTALANLTTAKTSIASLKITLQTAQDQLSVTTAPPIQPDIDAAKAQISSAQAAIENAKLAIANATIVAPFSGMMWNVTAQPGMVVSPNVPVLSIINSGVFKFDAYVSQTDVAQIQGGAAANVTLDAYGQSVTFPAKVTAVDTAQTTVNGSPAYHVTLYFTKADDRIRAGMTGNVLITTAQHDNVVQIPSRLILQSDNNNFVLLAQGNKTAMRQVTLGLSEDNGMVEVISGLNAGDKIDDF